MFRDNLSNEGDREIIRGSKRKVIDPDDRGQWRQQCAVGDDSRSSAFFD